MANAISKSNSDLNSQHESNDVAVIIRATSPCQNRFSDSERRIILNFSLQNHLRPVSLPSKIEIVATPSQRPIANIAELFHSRKLVLKIILKPIGKIGLVFKLAISLRKSIFIIKNRKPWHKFHRSLPSRNQFPKSPQASSMLDLSSQSEVCLAFFLCQEQGY